MELWRRSVGSFPAPIRLGVRNVAWIKAEIDAWEQARCAERGARRNDPKAANVAFGRRLSADIGADRVDASEAKQWAGPDAGADTVADTSLDTGSNTFPDTGLNTGANTGANAVMRDIFSDDHLYMRLLNLLNSTDPRDRLYVYRLHGERKLKPALHKGEPFPDLLNWLRDDHSGGKFAIMIRRGETMLLAGSVSVITPLRGR